MTEQPKKDESKEETGKTNEEIEEKLFDIPEGKKICPLMNGFFKCIICTPKCAFYRANKNGCECLFHELPSISYQLKRVADAKVKPSE